MTTWWCALTAVRFGIAAAATTATPPSTNTGSDTQFANYAFASELGSGIYESGGQSLQVYQFLPSYSLRAAQPRGGRPGIRLIFPLTVGFFNFQPVDLAHGQLPSSIGALSLERGCATGWSSTAARTGTTATAKCWWGRMPSPTFT